MKNSKLIHLLQSFSSKERRAFHDFIRSPYFNKNELLIEFYAYLKKLAPQGFPEKKISRRTVFQQLFPKQEYDEKQLNHLMSLLFKLAEQFVSLREYESDSIRPDYYLLKAYVNRQLEKHYQHIFQNTISKLNNSKRRDGYFYFQKHLLFDIANEHFVSLNVRRFDQNLQEAADAFDVYFLTQKLKYLCDMLDRQKFISADYQHHMIQQIDQLLVANDYLQVPAVELYHIYLQLLTKAPTREKFEKFRRLLNQQAAGFPLDEQKTLYYSAINFCINQIRMGDQTYTVDLMELYLEGIKSEIIFEKGYLSPWTYKNMIKLGLGLKRFEWVEEFVKVYTDKLPPEEREVAYHFNLADLYFHTKAYDKSLFHLNQVEFSDVHYSLGSKAMLLKIYFEKGETEAFLSLISSFKIFLKRNQTVSKNVMDAYQNFVSFLAKIQRLDKNDPDLLKEKIQQSKSLSDRNWLLQKLHQSSL